MNEKEFLDKIKDEASFYYVCKSKKGNQSWREYEYDHYRNSNELTIDDFVKVEWVSGGVSGGSCWDTGEGPDPHHPISGESEPEFECLDKILTKLVPDISYMKYKAIVSACVETDDRTVSEYYGNYTTYGVKKVVLRKLYDKMKELSLI